MLPVPSGNVHIDVQEMAARMESGTSLADLGGPSLQPRQPSRRAPGGAVTLVEPAAAGPSRAAAGPSNERARARNSVVFLTPGRRSSKLPGHPSRESLGSESGAYRGRKSFAGLALWNMARRRASSPRLDAGELSEMVDMTAAEDDPLLRLQTQKRESDGGGRLSIIRDENRVPVMDFVPVTAEDAKAVATASARAHEERRASRSRTRADAAPRSLSPL